MLCGASRSARLAARVSVCAAQAPRRGLATRSIPRSALHSAFRVPHMSARCEQKAPIVNLQPFRRSYGSMPHSKTTNVIDGVYVNNAALGAAAGAAVIAALYLIFDEVSAAEETISASVATASSMKDGEMREAKVGDTKILLAKVGGKIYATDLNCPHFGAPLNTGILAGESVSCPWHDARFNLKTGALESAPAIDGINTYLVTIKGHDVIVVVPKTPKKRSPVGKQCDTCDTRTFVIVGAGAAGATAAEALRQDGFKGKIVMLTDENKLPYDRTALSKNLGTPAEKITLRDEAFWKAIDVDIQREHKVRSVDARTRTITFEDGSTMAYDSCLLATGAKPRVLNVPGSDFENVRVLRTVDDSSSIAALVTPATKVVVIGSSFIGMELASALKKGKKVDNVVVVGMEKVPFERVLGNEVGEIMKTLGEENGIKFVMQRTAARFEGHNGKVTKVVLDDKSELEADLVVMGAGVIPNTQIVKNLPLNKDGSITVDRYMKAVNAEGLYAAGDIARFPYGGEDIRVEHWAVAQNQGRVAAHNMSGKSVPFENVPFFWTRSFDMSLTYAGHASSFDEVLVKGDKKKKQFVAFYVKDNNVKAVAAFGRGPQAIAAAELIRLNKCAALLTSRKMPSAADIRAAADVDLAETLRRAQQFVV